MEKAIIRGGGLASILGGMLWIALLLVVQLQMLGVVQFYTIPEPPCCDMQHSYSLENPLLALPLLFLLPGLMGVFLFTRQRLALSTLGNIGLVLSLSGIVLAITQTFFSEVGDIILRDLWFSGGWYGHYGGLVDPYWPPAGSLWLLWFASFGPGLVLLALGLMLFGLSILRTKRKPKALTSWSILILTSASLALFLLPWPTRLLLLSAEDLPTLQYSSGVFVSILLMFGLGWIALGYMLRNTPLVGERLVRRVKQHPRTQATFDLPAD